LVKLCFECEVKGGCDGERMWVAVTGVNGHDYTGCLVNHPALIYELKWGQQVTFSPKHILDIDRDGHAVQ
jgi:hypothetical protein